MSIEGIHFAYRWSLPYTKWLSINHALLPRRYQTKFKHVSHMQLHHENYFLCQNCIYFRKSQPPPLAMKQCDTFENHNNVCLTRYRLNKDLEYKKQSIYLSILSRTCLSCNNNNKEIVIQTCNICLWIGYDYLV